MIVQLFQDGHKLSIAILNMFLSLKLTKIWWFLWERVENTILVFITVFVDFICILVIDTCNFFMWDTQRITNELVLLWISFFLNLSTYQNTKIIVSFITVSEFWTWSLPSQMWHEENSTTALKSLSAYNGWSTLVT